MPARHPRRQRLQPVFLHHLLQQRPGPCGDGPVRRRTRATSASSSWRRTTRPGGRGRRLQVRFKGEMVDEVYVPLSQLDFSAELARIAAAKPDAIFTFMPGGLGVNLVRQYRQAGLADNIPFLGLHGGRGDAAGAAGCGAGLLIRGMTWAPNMDNAENTRFVPTSRPATATSPPATPRRATIAPCCWTRPSADRRQRRQGRAAGGAPRGGFPLRPRQLQVRRQPLPGAGFLARARWRSAPTASSRPRPCARCWRTTPTPGRPNAACADRPRARGAVRWCRP